MRGADNVDSGDIANAIATEESPKFLGVARGVVYDYEIFDRATLQRDLARIERYYRTRGYYGAHARAGRVLSTGPGHVRVEIVVEEGEPTVNGPLTIDGINDLPSKVKKSTLDAAQGALPPGKAFEEDQGDAVEKVTRKALTDAGYAYATVQRDTFIDIIKHVATTHLVATPGATARLGAISFEGVDANGAAQTQKISESTLRRELELHEGDPYSTAELDDATQALLDLEVFVAVTIVPDLSHPETRVVPVRIRVEPAKMHQVSVGVGAEVDAIKTELHLIGSWEDHDFLGGLRDFSVHFQPGLVFFPTRIDNLVAPDHFFPGEKLRAELKQPGFIEARTEAFVRPELNVFPLLVQTDPNPNDPVVGYIEGKGGVGVDRTFWKKFYASLSYEVQVEHPFGYKDPLDPDLSTLIITYPELVMRLDLRDDRDHPHGASTSRTTSRSPAASSAARRATSRSSPRYAPTSRSGAQVTFATRASLGIALPVRTTARSSRTSWTLHHQREPRGARQRHPDRPLSRALLRRTDLESRLPHPRRVAARRRAVPQPLDGLSAGGRLVRRRAEARRELHPTRREELLGAHRRVHALGAIERGPLRHQRAAERRDVLRHRRRLAAPARPGAGPAPRSPAPLVWRGRAVRHAGRPHPRRRRLPRSTAASPRIQRRRGVQRGQLQRIPAEDPRHPASTRDRHRRGLLTCRSSPEPPRNASFAEPGTR